MLKPNTQGRDRRIIAIPLIRTVFFTGCAEQINGKADDIFKYGNNRRLGGKRHEDEEQNTENPPADHLVEDVGQSDEHQSGPCPGSTPNAKQDGKIISPARKSNQCVQKADIDCFPCQGAVFTDVAAENRHCTDAEAQGKEGLSHCGEDRVADAVFCKSGKIRNQIKAQSLGSAGQCHTADTQNEQDEEQTAHHRLGNTLHTFLQTETADKKLSRTTRTIQNVM